jgi:hypothetical protein
MWQHSIVLEKFLHPELPVPPVCSNLRVLKGAIGTNFIADYSAPGARRAILAVGGLVTGTIDAEPINADGVTPDGSGGFVDKDWYQVTLTSDTSTSSRAAQPRSRPEAWPSASTMGKAR